MGVDPVANSAKAGERVQVNTHITATGGDVSGVKVVHVAASSAKATVGGECTAPYTSTGCSVGDLTSGHRDTVVSTVSVPATIKDDLTVTFSIEVSATDIPAKTWTAEIKFVAPAPSPSPSKTPTKSPSKTPTKSPSKTPTKSPSKSPSPSASATPSASSSGNRQGSSSGGGSGSSGGSGGSGGTTSGTGYVPPAPNSSFQAKNPQVALPPIAAPTPSIAPNTAAVTPESRLRGNKAPVAQDLTFERVASTQVAWLAALMVAIAVLLTQLRLGKRRAPAGAASAAMRRARGMHRRTRRGMFGK
ncbi:hypothetical protein [Actinomadura montaniterrae]|uniref:DUF11 domain-containing protein n=1 Tax=Actinomadura montaniterrae TaxID=1803903 RepID=A0A6L3VF17_9ACTN|nr:hypothetical protein [Actinomadura montaniterrae]KAB2364191.1 hypothetical protein F9B16_42035 [Actinomadura montaniterrae]